MKIPPFRLEEFWKKYEFSAPYLLCPSDAESWSLEEILDLADPEAKKLWKSLRLGYTETSGLPLLRETIADLYPTLNGDQILTFAGSEEGIYCGIKSLLSPGDHAIVVTPCYQSLETISLDAGAEVTSICLSPHNHWQLSLEELANAFRSNTKLIVTTLPHQPTGALIKKSVFEGMIELARERDCHIFCDEMYRFLEIDVTKRLPSIADAYEKGIALFGITKPFGLAGLRIGWLASQDKSFIAQVSSRKHYTSICNSGPSEILALIALRAREIILTRNRSILMENLALLDQLFERKKKVLSWVRPESGTIAFPELLLPISIDTFADELVEKAGVLIMPGSIFDFPGNFFRIGFGRKNMSEALERFEQFLEAYANL